MNSLVRPQWNDSSHGWRATVHSVISGLIEVWLGFFVWFLKTKKNTDCALHDCKRRTSSCQSPPRDEWIVKCYWTNLVWRALKVPITTKTACSFYAIAWFVAEVGVARSDLMLACGWEIYFIFYSHQMLFLLHLLVVCLFIFNMPLI